MDNMEYISTRLQCDEEGKRAVCGVVRRLYRYALLTRMYGLLALEEELKKETHPFLRDCLSRLADSMEPEWLKEYMTIRILAENAAGQFFLEMMVIADGVLQIQRQDNPGILLARLGAWFGSGFQDQFREETAALGEQAQALLMENAGREQKNREHSVCPMFDGLGEVAAPALQRILHAVTADELALALQGAGHSVYERLVACISEQRRRRLAEDMEALRYTRACDSRRAQEKIMEIAARLERDGEIILNKE